MPPAAPRDGRIRNVERGCFKSLPGQLFGIVTQATADFQSPATTAASVVREPVDEIGIRG